MSDWIFNDHLSPAWDTPAGLNGLDDLHHPTTLLQTDDGHLTIVSEAKGAHGHSGGGTGGTTGGTGGTTGGTPPAGTLVGSSTGLQIDLIWDQSVLSAPNASAIENTVITAAEIFTANFTTHAVLNIEVGLNEIGGSSMSSGALGESQTYGMAVSYATLTSALGSADAGLVSSGLMAAGAATADTALAAKTFFVPLAEAKALGLTSATSSSIDGAIGLGSSALSFTGVVGSGQFDGVGVAAHEISEVMGRISDVGAPSGYATPLDVFRYSAAHTPSTSASVGYFSTDAGVTVLNTYNNGSNGGDSADWASSTANTLNAFDAFGNSSGTMKLNANDLLEVAALGYHPAGTLGAVTA